ncbi:hypothetical protein D3C73_1515850 [compost metagenome]
MDQPRSRLLESMTIDMSQDRAVPIDHLGFDLYNSRFLHAGVEKGFLQRKTDAQAADQHLIGRRDQLQRTAD